jgi:nitrogenase-stabilizing/protective protein
MSITLPGDIQHLSTAEEFLEHFGIRYDPQVVRVSRLHILQRFHDYLATAEFDGDEEARLTAVGGLLARAYSDFVRSDPLGERVFKVLKDAQARLPTTPGRVFVPLAAVTGRPPARED